MSSTINKVIPAPLVAIVVMTILVVTLGLETKNISDMGTISATLPEFLFPNVQLTFETLMIILPYSISLAFVGLIEDEEHDADEGTDRDEHQDVTHRHNHDEQGEPGDERRQAATGTGRDVD
ncbi:SulP family inorganic anion transporter, partial [Acinetobacter soli]